MKPTMSVISETVMTLNQPQRSFSPRQMNLRGLGNDVLRQNMSNRKLRDENQL